MAALPYDTPLLLHEIIASGAERHPASTAFRCHDNELTYASLCQQASGLATLLSQLDVKKGDRVGVMLPKCIYTSIAVFGVMARGAAFVPLDPAMPPARLNAIARDCQINVLITHPVCARLLIAAKELGLTTSHVIAVEPMPQLDDVKGLNTHDWSDIKTLDGISLRQSMVTESSLAYVMYTSGSTGQPKGLMHTHASGLAYARMSARLFGLHAEDRLASHSPLHFDMCTLDYFSGPLAGACTVILPEAHMKIPASLSKLIDDESLSIWYSVPYALIQLLLHGALDQRDLGTLRWVLYGGEPFAPRHLSALMKRLPNARFGNVYGPAEVNHVTFHEITTPPNESANSVPIGRPCPNANAVILGEDDLPVVTGKAGELVVQTPQMMQGYWNRPDLSAVTLFQRPGFNYVAPVWCRTGDLVFENHEGDLELIGRKDRLIKTRGNRVELDEVEAVLSAVNGVEEAAAFVYHATDDSNDIGAVVTQFAKSGLVEKEIRSAVAQRLPAYAVPRRVAIVDSFPRTGSDKIARSELAKWFETDPVASTPANTAKERTKRESSESPRDNKRTH